MKILFGILAYLAAGLVVVVLAARYTDALIPKAYNHFGSGVRSFWTVLGWPVAGIGIFCGHYAQIQEERRKRLTLEILEAERAVQSLLGRDDDASTPEPTRKPTPPPAPPQRRLPPPPVGRPWLPPVPPGPPSPPKRVMGPPR